MSGEVPEILWFLFWVGLAIAGLGSATWAGVGGHKSRMKALDILRVYAERGIEPPAELSEPLLKQLTPPTVSRRSDRARHLERFTFSLFMAGASAGVAWWRADAGGEPKWLFYAAGVAAFAFTAGAVAELIAALSSPRS